MERTGIYSEESKLLIECLLSGQMSVRQFMEHCKENPELLDILKILNRRYERCGHVSYAKENLMIQR
jgi:hypothetical protein